MLNPSTAHLSLAACRDFDNAHEFIGVAAKIGREVTVVPSVTFSDVRRDLLLLPETGKSANIVDPLITDIKNGFF